MSMCYTYLHEIADDTGVDGDEKKNSKAAGFRANPNFQALMKELEVQQARGFSIHPKMDMLKTLVVQYFGQRMGEGDGGEDDGGEATRVMVFVTFRAAVEEIVEVLNAEKPLIRATKFIGQGTDKQGKKGFAQKEQLEVRIITCPTGGSR
jgi:ATP-dependent DNA helicase MPH1